MSNVGNKAFFARTEFKVKIKGSCGGTKREQITAVAVSDYGIETNSKGVRFLYFTGTVISRGIKNCLEVPRSN